MAKRILTLTLFYCLTCFSLNANKAVEPCDMICGKWQSEKKNCIVEVSHDDDDYVARLVWFDDSDDPSKPMESRLDTNNPDKKLRSRKLVGMNVLQGLVYKSKTNSWENGMIYDAQTGKKWNAAANLVAPGKLKVTGYWHFKFIGRSMIFNRVSS
ncbi:DUF2147 domain-containing protein [uncultured Mucilaginibacter sp.]|uniref:DUF2147 domain-containing protein n=1 Tax=uncultured Mucilaginibacter sp. TaxID=797541 RepID=UPI0025E2E02D|nr:DUF2147 domain-containing protein [uncultured Mucilaginibacter sp.]